MDTQKNYAVMKLEDVGKEIDQIIKDSAPMAMMEAETFTAALSIAHSVKRLREIFLTHPGIKEDILAMKDTRLGFLTDRSPKAIAKANAQGKKLIPYTYEVVAEVCIEGLLKGYRVTNNEMNMIAGNFYPAKNGKHRKIIEHPDVSGFDYTTTSPQYDTDGKSAKVKGFATWMQDGTMRSFGISDPEKGIEDTQVFKIRVNKAMGEDAVIGKAQSKLFGRVLERIMGRPLPESTDIEYADQIIDAEATNGRSLKVEPEEKPPGDPYKVKDLSQENMASIRAIAKEQETVTNLVELTHRRRRNLYEVNGEKVKTAGIKGSVLEQIMKIEADYGKAATGVKAYLYILEKEKDVKLPDITYLREDEGKQLLTALADQIVPKNDLDSEDEPGLLQIQAVNCPEHEAPVKVTHCQTSCEKAPKCQPFQEWQHGEGIGGCGNGNNRGEKEKK